MCYERFNKLLQEFNVTPYKVAKETGVNQGTLTGWKKGEYAPKIDKLKKIADYFDVSVEWLSGESNERNPVSEIKKEPTSKDMDSIIDDIDIYYYGGDKNMTEEQRKQLKRIIAATLNEDNK